MECPFARIWPTRGSCLGRHSIPLWGSALIVLLGCWSSLTAKPPNVLLIISDDQAWTDYGFMGHPHIRTPHLDRLARESLTFTRGYVPSSLCRPSLASIISGLYPHEHRIVGNDPAPLPGQDVVQSRREPEYQQLRERLIAHVDELPTLPRWLSDSGYVSHQSGKWWEGSFRRGGFTHGMTRGFPEPGGRHGDDGLLIGREGLQPVFQFIQHAKSQQQPFLVWYAPFMPHTPHTPPERLLEYYREKTPSLAIAKYWAMCEWFDETCGELLAFLDREQLREDTIVIYVTDNGWLNRADASAYAPRSKRSPYDGGLRTPIMVRYPGHTRARIDDQSVVSSLDLAPTILRACGQTPPAGLPGVDLLDTPSVTRRERIFGEVFRHDVVDVDRPSASLRYRWIIQMPWKMIVPNPRLEPHQSIELYHLLNDPFEQTDRSGEEDQIRRQLQSELNRWWKIDI